MGDKVHKFVQNNIDILSPPQTQNEMLFWNLSQAVLALAEEIEDEASVTHARLAAIELALEQLSTR